MNLRLSVGLRSSLSAQTAQTVWLENATLCSLSLLLWGWQTNLLFLAVPMAIALEARRVVKQRWEVSENDLKEIGKLSGALLLLLFVVIVITQKAVFIYTFLQWLPVAAFPLVMAQTYGLGVSARVYNIFSNPYLPQNSDRPTLLNLHYAFMGLCIFSASAAETEGFAFYHAAAILVGLILWPIRPKGSSVVLWMLLFTLSVGWGFAGHQQLAHFQQRIEAQMLAMMGRYSSGAVNPDGTRTAMGSVGKLKLSKKIIARVQSDSEDTFPLLLQEASYNQYQLVAWDAVDGIFQPVPPAEEDGEWILAQASGQDKTISISTDLERAEGILTLPRNITRIQNLPVEEMQRSQYGAVQVDAEGSTTYQVQFAPTPIVNRSEARPTPIDLEVPALDAAAVRQTLEKIFPNNTIEDLSPTEISTRISAYLQSFTYSLDLIRADLSSDSPISDFLLSTQKGHCEYFASATALLLRGAGIPARYAVGYSAHEFSPLEGQYLVRSRDAHAWTLAFIEDRWRVVDNTPPDWTAQEREMESIIGTAFRSISDFFSFLGFQGSLLVRRLGELGLKEVLIIIIPVGGYLIWRTSQQFQGKRKRLAKEGAVGYDLVRYGLDSDLYDLEKRLCDRYSPRQQTESLAQWLTRLRSTIDSPLSSEDVHDLLKLHYRYRFDPQGLSLSQRAKLTALCQKWTQYLKAEASRK